MSKFIVVAIVVALVLVFWKFAAGNRNAAQANREKGQAFLAANKQEEGVKATPSGLQYQVLTPGTGTEHPKPNSTVKVHYHGTLLDGTVFDSSVDRGQPIEFGLHQVIPGWTEGLQLMVVGEKTRLFIPSELAYGNRAAGAILPGSTLIFDVELLEIN